MVVVNSHCHILRFGSDLFELGQVAIDHLVQLIPRPPVVDEEARMQPLVLCLLQQIVRTDETAAIFHNGRLSQIFVQPRTFLDFAAAG